MKKVFLLISMALMITVCFGQQNKPGDYLIKSGTTFYVGSSLSVVGAGLILAASQIKPIEKKSFNGTTTIDNSTSKSLYAFGSVISLVGVGVMFASFSNLILAGKELNKTNKSTAFILNQNGAGFSYSLK